MGLTLPNHPLPTLEDVAREAQVSTATVSRSLNSPQSVAEKTLLRVQAAVDMLGYSPNFGARALAARRTNTIGAVIPTFENAIFAQGLQSFEETISKCNLTLLVASSSYQQEREEEQIRALVARGADAILLIGEERSKEIYDFLAKRNIPCVISWFYRPDSNHCLVGFDNRAAACELARKVLGLGHRKISMIAGLTANNDRARSRLIGVKDALVEFDIPHRNFDVVEVPYSFRDGGDALETLISKSDRPTAIICGNDVLAVGALQRAKAMGLRVPQEISITGFDDIEISSITEPELTTVHVPHRKMGKIAAEHLMEMQITEASSPGQELKTYIVERNSLTKPCE